MSDAVIKMTNSELYRINFDKFEGWAEIAVCATSNNISVLINSDYGSFSGIFKYKSGCHKNFLINLSHLCCLRTLSNGNLYVSAPEHYPTEIKKSIIAARKENRINKKVARKAWKQLLNTEHQNGDLFYHELVTSKYFNQVFGEYENLPSAKKINPALSDLWHNVWLPFTEYLRKEQTSNN